VAGRIEILRQFAAARWRWSVFGGSASAEEKLADYQEQRARRMVRFAWERSPFYRAHWQGRDLDDWRSLPAVDKRLMMANFSAFNTCGVPLEQAMQTALRAEESRDFSPVLPGTKHLTVGLSSGTSGHRGLFLVSPEEQAAWAGIILARTLHSIPWAALLRGGLRVAFFLRSNSNLYQQTNGGLIQFRYFDLMDPLPASTGGLNAYQPEILIGPPLLLGQLAAEQQAGRLQIRPARLISVAEVLEPQEKQRLETVFQVKVEQIFQCTEGLLAVTCAEGSLHLQEDLVAVQLEPLDSMQNGEEKLYTPILTDLWRTTQPILRYRLNDLLALTGEPCACGSAFRALARIEGRSDDICYFPQVNGGLRPFYPDAIRKMVLLAHPQIEDYRVVQSAPGCLQIFLAAAPAAGGFEELARAVRSSVETGVAGYGCRAALVEIVEGLPALAPGSKRRRVMRVG